ncbi:hypothetical protein JCM10212_004102 [Sporobolomyces blumeae]
MLRRSTFKTPCQRSFSTSSTSPHIFLRPSPPVLSRPTRSISAAATTTTTTTAPADEGSIASVFSSLSGEAFVPLEGSFRDLKRTLWNDGLIESWRSVLAALETRTEEIGSLGTDAIPQVSFADLPTLSPSTVSEIRRVGTVLIHDAVSEQEALDWKREIQDYIAQNRERAKGFPADDPQVWEVYNSISQTRARTHPNLLESQKFLLSLFHTSDPTSPVSTRTPVSYFDRLRIRFPGDAVFALGPHVDGGSLERWVDPGFRSCFKQVLAGGPEPHKRLDSWDLSPRLNATTDLYDGKGQCSVFRGFQGWTSLSHTSPGEGTLQVFPDVNLASAYIILRPFFRPRRGREDKLGFDDWEVDLDSTDFPGSVKGKGQELSPSSHPHLRLAETMTSIPAVAPGSQAFWHADVVHSVESVHRGASDSSVLYIPACPLTKGTAEYLGRQREAFKRGSPPEDFPQGEGEAHFVGRAGIDDLESVDARRVLGLERFVCEDGETDGGREVVEEANRILFGLA